MDLKNFVSPLGPRGGWEGLGNETPSPAPILMPSALGLMRKILKKHIITCYRTQVLTRYGGYEGAIAPSCFNIHELEPTPRPPQTRDFRMKKKV
jgi:hypothetical protein